MKSLFIIALTFIYFSVYSQNQLPKNEEGKIVFTDVIQTENQLSEDHIYTNIKQWLSTKPVNFNRSNSEKHGQGTQLIFGQPRGNFKVINSRYRNDNPIKLENPKSHKLIAKVATKYTGGTMGCIRIAYIEYDLILLTKDGRYKYSLENFT